MVLASESSIAMNVSCPACATEYIVDQPDERNFHGNTARMRCGACDTVWLVSRVAEPETSPQLQQARPASDRAHAAVVRRGTAREMRDMFATRDPDLGSVKQTLRPAPFSSGVAARNETSVLFTIDSLKSAAAQKTPPPPPMTNSAPSGRPDDDDGLIDLKALSSVPPRVAPNAPQPLFTSEPPPGAFARELSSPGSLLPLVRKRPTAKLVGAIAGGVVATVLMVVGIAVAFRGEEPAKNVATASIAAAKPVIQAPVVAPPPPAPEPAAAAAPAAKEEEAKPVAAGKKGKGGKGKGSRPSPASGLQKVGSSGVAAKSEAAPAPRPAAKSADACGCKGNFDCIIRCSAKGK